MSETSPRLYSDLAWLWPLWGDPAENYGPYCEHVTQLVRKYARGETRTLLNIGCGGGKNAFNLKENFIVTGLDISPAMLDLARQLNPECTFRLDDMRTFDWLDRFDAVLIDDAISYMTSEADLRAVFERAYTHLKPGGVMVCGPDYTKETFVQNCTRVSRASSRSKPEHIEVIFVENDFDPDPQDTSYEAAIIYMIREHGRLRVEHDLHRLGLFPLETWRKLLAEVGFEVHEEVFEAQEGERDPLTFACFIP